LRGVIKKNKILNQILIVNFYFRALDEVKEDSDTFKELSITIIPRWESESNQSTTIKNVKLNKK
jgi:hypothetical protein